MQAPGIIQWVMQIASYAINSDMLESYSRELRR